MRKWLWLGVVLSSFLGLGTFLPFLFWSPSRRGPFWEFIDASGRSAWPGWAMALGAVGLFGCLIALLRAEQDDANNAFLPSPDGDYSVCVKCGARVERRRRCCGHCGEAVARTQFGLRQTLIGISLLVVATLASFGSCAEGFQPTHLWWLVGAVLGCNGMILALVLILLGSIRKG